MPKELEWLLTESPMKLDRTPAADGRTLCEGARGAGSGYFFMPYGMIPVSVNEMLLQTYDGVIRVFPCVPPVLDAHPVRFFRLRAFDGFAVSAERDKGTTRRVMIESSSGKPCRMEVPADWREAGVADATTGRAIPFVTKQEKVRIDRQLQTVSVITFETTARAVYNVTDDRSR